ncbi:MAG TPA: hypothetical protein VKB86_08580 [Pyrinomonadaceae bacterium]|nr:hypothetical protein [Pyrinomonadaceae bacterium]
MSSSNPGRRSPYQGLIPYSEQDAPFFFGREKETRLITANLFASPLTLLYGASGVGKSSVLRAGVANQLRERDDLLVVVFNAWQSDPLSDLQRTIASAAEHLNGKRLDPPASSDLAKYLAQCSSQLNRRVMIILDQFEEYFLYHSQEDDFSAQLPRAVMHAGVPVSFLISLREDALAKLDRFEGRIPTLFDNYLRIEHLNVDAGRAAILNPIEEYNRLYANDSPVTIERELVETVLEQVKTGEVILGETGQGVVKQDNEEAQIETPYLQMVMMRLWDEEMRKGSRRLRLETLNELGGAKNIVRTHLDTAMSALPEEEQSVAARVFHHLVTPSGAKIAHTVPDLAAYARVPQEQLAFVMKDLLGGNVRILRDVASPPDQPDAPRYEIFHDVLAPAILDWRARFVKAQELAEAERLAEEQRQQAEARARVEEQAKSARRLRWLSIALAVMTVLAFAAAAYAFKQRAIAESKATEALAQARDASNAKEQAESQGNRANNERERAESERNRANDERDRARGFATVADQKAKEADAERKKADEERKRAESESKRANDERDKANEERKRADQQAMLARENEQQAIQARADAEMQRGIAVTEASKASSRELAASAHNNLISDPELSILLARQAVEKNQTEEALNALHEAVQASRARYSYRLTGEPVEITASPVDSRMAAALKDGTVKVWDAASGKELFNLPQYASDIEKIAFSPDGNILAVAYKAGEKNNEFHILLRDAKTGQSLGQTLKIPNAGELTFLRELTFKDNETLIAGIYSNYASAGSCYVNVYSWNVADHQLKTSQNFGCNGGMIRGSVFSRDGTRLFTLTDKAEVWDTISGKMLQDLSGQHIKFPAIFSLDAKRLLAHDYYENQLRSWDIDSGKVSSEKCGLLSISGDEQLVLSPNGRYLAAFDPVSDAIQSSTVRIMDTDTGKELDSMSLQSGTNKTERMGKILLAGVQFSPDSERLAAFTNEGIVKIRAFRDKDDLFTISPQNNRVMSIAFSHDGKYLVTTTANMTTKVWDVSIPKDTELFTMQDRWQRLSDLTFLPDGSLLANAIDRGGQSGVRNVYTGQPWSPINESVDRISWTPDGKRAVTIRLNEGQVWEIDSSKGRVVRNFSMEFSTDRLAISPNGKRVAVDMYGKKIEVWDVDSKRDPLIIPHSYGVYSMAFSPDGRYLVIGSSDNTAKVLDVSSSKPTEPYILSSQTEVLAVAFSPHGRYIATAGQDRTVNIWEFSTHRLLHTLIGHGDKVTDIAFSPDEKSIATASADRTARVWDVNSGEELLTLTDHINPLNHVVFSADGKRLATSSEDGTVHVYALELQELKRLAGERTSRDFTVGECKRYLRLSQEQCERYQR